MAFATILEERLRDHVPLASRAVDRAPLGVLESANMPAVLVEMGFLTNADQEKQLTGNDFQNAFVQAMYGEHHQVPRLAVWRPQVTARRAAIVDGGRAPRRGGRRPAAV